MISDQWLQAIERQTSGGLHLHCALLYVMKADFISVLKGPDINLV